MPLPILQRWLLLTLIASVALWLRLDDLTARPMHADEANQAVKLGQLIETGRYTFDPRDHHGPTLYYAARPIAWLRGETTLASLTGTTVRLVPALAGTLGVLLLAWLAWPVCRAPATGSGSVWLPLGAAAFLAVSPPAVYYSRYFVQETLLATFTLAAFVCVQRWWRRPHVAWALAAGGCMGLMQATKATAPLFLAAAACAWLVVRLRAGSSGHLERDPHTMAVGSAGAMPSGPSVRRPFGRHVIFALAAALIVAAGFYSSFGTHWAGLEDALATYTSAADRAASGAGHQKPWWYYLQLLAWQRTGGLLWHQLAFTALALCGAALAFLRLSRSHVDGHLTPGFRSWRSSAALRGSVTTERVPAPDDPAAHAAGHDANFGIRVTGEILLLRGAAVYTAIVALVFSAIPYKTPWHVIHLIPGLALLAAGALAFLAAAPATVPYPPAEGATARGLENARRFRQLTSWIVTTLVFIAVLQTLSVQTRLAVFLRPADARNPYAYVHSSPDVQKVRALAGAALTVAPNGIIRVISEEYWPLPWYLRDTTNVGYWTAPPAQCDGALVLASASLADTVRDRLTGRYRESYLGLRPDFLLVVFTPTP